MLRNDWFLNVDCSAIAALLLFAADASADSPLVQLNAFPPDVNLTTAKDRQLVVVQAVQADGITRDVSKEATFTFANPGVVPSRGEQHFIPRPTDRQN